MNLDDGTVRHPENHYDANHKGTQKDDSSDNFHKRFYAISYEEVIKHPALNAITKEAKGDLFLNRE